MPSLMPEKNLINLQDKFVESIGVFSPHAPTPSETVYHPTRKKDIIAINFMERREIGEREFRDAKFQQWQSQFCSVRQ
jgi:hypothetical protein